MKLKSALTHKTSRVSGVGAHFAVHLDKALLHNFEHLVAGECILEPVTQENHQRKALAQLVWACARPRCVHTSKLVQHPCLRRVQTLQVLLRAASLNTNLYLKCTARLSARCELAIPLAIITSSSHNMLSIKTTLYLRRNLMCKL